MNAIPTTFLSQIKTISALKTLVAFFAMRDKLGKDEFEYSLKQLAVDFELSENSARVGVKELVSLGMLEVTEKNFGKSNIYKLILTTSKIEDVKVCTPAKVEDVKSCTSSKVAVADSTENREEYRVAVATRKKKEVQQSEIEKDIYNIDFNNINIYTKDINSFSVINKNLMMNEEELGKLAARVLREVFMPMARPVIPVEPRARAIWFQKQVSMIKGLLVEYRVEQIVAAVHYWTKIAPPPKGITSMYFLKIVAKRTKQGSITNLMVALHYFKSEYTANEHEFNKAEIEERLAEQARREEEEKIAAAKRAEEVANMKPDDFVAGMLGRFKLNIAKDE